MNQVLHYLLHHSFVSVAGSLVYAAIASVAVLRGDLPARWVGLALLVEFLLTLALDNYTHVGTIAPGVFAMDVMLFGYIFWLAVAHFRAWLVAAGAAQLIAVCTHLAKLFDPKIVGWIYTSCEIVCTYGVVAALAVSLLQDGNEDDVRVAGR